jgi:translation elongation factor EF-Ts
MEKAESRGKIKEGIQRRKLESNERAKHMGLAVDDKKTVADVITEQIHKMGENIYIKRFVRLEVGG